MILNVFALWTARSDDQEISVAYYRSAYATTDYPTEKVLC